MKQTAPGRPEPLSRRPHLYCAPLVPRVSVIVCSRDRPDSLGRCLKSIAALDGPAPEVVVVDNTHGDQETERLATEAGARYIVEPMVGLSRARNAGIEAAAGELIAFLDDDALADAAWLEEHSRVLEDEALTATSGRILPLTPDNGRGLLDLGEQSFVVDRSDPWWFERANFGGVAAGGSNMVIKRRVFDEGVRFRETLGLGSDLAWFEEHYLLFNIIRDGGRVVYVPSAVVRHRNPVILTEHQRSRATDIYRYSAAYLTMLFVEEPEFRSKTIRYAFGGLRSEDLPWRDRPQPSRLKMLAAGYRGPLLYLRSRRSRR